VRWTSNPRMKRLAWSTGGSSGDPRPRVWRAIVSTGFCRKCRWVELDSYSISWSCSEWCIPPQSPSQSNPPNAPFNNQATGSRQSKRR
jgi:hypothetical protein